jgi:ABC-type lipoprotein release transport system permease subunit
MIAQVAWRNVWRNKVRSLVVISSVVVGIWAAAFIISFATGMKHSYVETAIENEVSHLQIHVPGYLSDPDLTKLIPKADNMVTVIKKMQQVKAVTARLLINAMASTPTNTTGAIVRGIDTADENSVTHIRGHIISGTYLDDNNLPVLVGSALAEKLNLKMHHKLVLTFQDVQGNITSAAFKVTGIYATTNSTFDENNMFVRRSDLASLLSISDKAAEIAILLKQDDKVTSVQKSLAGRFPGIEVKNWKEIAPELALMVESQNESLYLIVLIIVLALMFGIINTMMMAVLERIHEIGMLMAIGMNKTRLFFMIMTETLYLSLAGIPLGLMLSYVTISVTGRHGINLGTFSKGLSSYGLGTIVRPVLTPQFYGIVALFIFLAALLGSFYPAAKALRIEPARALQSF